MLDREQLEREASHALAQALSPSGVALDIDERRALLQRAITHARAASASPEPTLPAVAMLAQRTIARACAALAEAARHGAGQLSLSAQRAPSSDACEDGWSRAAQIVAECESFARDAQDAARMLADSSPNNTLSRDAQRAAARAQEAARSGRALLDGRNHAFTLHTDEGFSFGEGWHVAAAAVLAGAPVQIEAGHAATPHVERFLRDSGVGSQIVAPRPRPRAMKQTTELVGRAFAQDALDAQRRLRAAWLGDEPTEPTPLAVRAFVRARGLEPSTTAPRVALWVRNGAHQPERNTDGDELRALVRLAIDAGLSPLLVGEAPSEDAAIEGAIDLSLHRVEPVFRGELGRRAQLQLFELLRESHALVGQLGVTSAGMDGPALLGLRTAYITAQPNPRMRQWVDAVPGYEELLRDERFLSRVRELFARWAKVRE